MKKALLWAISILLFSQSLCYASDARVDSMGGLTLVATDEADDINPFTLGNPAGLALLAPQTRLDVGTQWIKEYFPPSGDQFHIYGLMNELSSDNGKYHGLMVFLNNNWAVQVDGDTLHTEGENDFSSHVDTDDRYRETLKTAFNFGPFTLGGQIQPSQSNIVFKSYQFNLSNFVISGNGTINAFAGTGGLLLNLLGANNPKQDQLRVGGVVSSQLNPSQEVDSFPVSNTLSTNTFTLTETTTDQNVLTWGPEIYFDSPGSFQLGLMGRFSSFDVYFKEDSTNTGSIADVANFKDQTGTISAGTAIIKITTPITDGMNLKTGGFFTIENTNTTGFLPAGTTNGGVSETAWNGQLGVGFEHPQDYTIGVQASVAGVMGNEGNASAVTTTNNFIDYKISVGGEHWLSKVWALRLGVVYEDANNRGTAEENQLLFPVDPGQEIFSTTIVAGLGYDDSRLKVDLSLSTGQPSVANDPSGYGNLYGAQCAASLLF
jgi:hypothetical protein